MGYQAGRTPCVNGTLISIKLVVFFVISGELKGGTRKYMCYISLSSSLSPPLSGLTALHILHATKPLLLGLNFSEYRTISIVAPFVSILGPLFVGPWADRLAAKNPNGFGRTLRILTAVCLVLAALIYSGLFFIPSVERTPVQKPKVSFGCDGNGAYIFQKLCNDSAATCHSWESKKGQVNLTRCTYSCQDPNHHENMYQFWLNELPTASPSTEQSSEFDYEEEASTATTERIRARRQLEAAPVELTADSAGVEQHSSEVSRVTRQVKNTPNKVYVEPPHLCITKDNHVKRCHVYTEDTASIVMNTVMGSAMSVNKTNETAGWCQYPLGEYRVYASLLLSYSRFLLFLRGHSVQHTRTAEGVHEGSAGQELQADHRVSCGASLRIQELLAG